MFHKTKILHLVFDLELAEVGDNYRCRHSDNKLIWWKKLMEKNELALFQYYLVTLQPRIRGDLLQFAQEFSVEKHFVYLLIGITPEAMKKAREAFSQPYIK